MILSPAHVFCLSRPAAAAHWCRQALTGCFQGQLICAETTWPKETRKKRPNSVFLGLKHLVHCPKSRYKPPFCAPSRPPLSPSGHHGHTRPRSSPPTTSPACSRKQSSIVLHFRSVRCLRSSGANVEKMPRWIVSKSLRSAMCAPLAAPADIFSHQGKLQ